MMNDDVTEDLGVSGRWRARDVSYCRGHWEQIKRHIPRFETQDFRATPDAPANPYMKSVIRLPRTKFEQAVPVGTVSNTYTLAQHDEVAEMCFKGIRTAGIDPAGMKCELGLTELGEWMNLRLYFPEDYSYTPRDKHRLDLRLECFDSVDASSRLVILLGWLRFVCSNGLVIGETKAELKDVHNKHMDLEKIPDIVAEGLAYVQKDLERISWMEKQSVDQDSFLPWMDKTLTEAWNKKAACRVFHICKSGEDVEITDPFATGTASEKPVARLAPVPGAPAKAANLYDVSQALSWVATSRNNPEERVEWQSAIPGLIRTLAVQT